MYTSDRFYWFIVFFHLVKSTPVQLEEHTTQTSTITFPSTTAKLCRDEWYCGKLNLDESTCQHVPDIFKACYATCTECDKCNDHHVCSVIKLSPLLCQHSAFVREHCPQGCQLCEQNTNQGIRTLSIYQYKTIRRIL